MIKRTLSFLIVRRFTKIFVFFIMFVFLLQNAEATPFNEQNSIHSNKDNNNLNQKGQKNPKVINQSKKKQTVGSKEVLSKKSSQKSKSENNEKIPNKKETALSKDNNINGSKVNSPQKAILNDQKDLGKIGKIFESRHEKDKKKIKENISTNKINKSQNVNKEQLNKKPKHKNNVTKKIVNSKITPKHTNISTKSDKKLISPAPLKKVNSVTSANLQKNSSKSNRIIIGKVLKKADTNKNKPEGKENFNHEADIKDIDHAMALWIQKNLNSNEAIINVYGATEIISPVKYTNDLRDLENANHLVGLDQIGRKTDQRDSNKSIKMGTIGSFVDISNSGSKEIDSPKKADEPLFFNISKERFDLILKAFLFGFIGIAFLFVRLKKSARRNHISRFKRKSNNS